MSAPELLSDRRRKNDSEHGFTFVELIISIVLLTLLTGGISAAFVTAMNNTGATTDRVNTSNVAQVIAAFLVRDAQAAGGVDPTNPALIGDPTLGVSLGDPAACATGTGTLQFRFKWRDWVTSTVSHLHVANYFYKSGTNELVRATCVDGGPAALATLGSNITSVSPSCNPAAGCPGIPDSVSLQITETTGSSPISYTYTLRATVRPQGQAAPSGGTTASFPSILSLGGCSTGTSSGSTTPGLSVTGNSTAGIFGPVVVNATDTSSPSCNALNISSAKVVYFAPTTSVPTGGSCTGNQCPPLNQNVSALPDPYSTLPAPGDCSSPAGTQTTSGGVTNFTPGVFTGSVTVDSTAVFASGNYIFCGGVTFSGAVTATSGVLFYIASGSVTIGSHSSLSITPQSSGTWAGLSMWIPSTNPLSSFAISSGSSLLSPAGIFYAPGVDVTLDGQSQVALLAMIARTVSIASNDTFAHFGQPATVGSPSPTVSGTGSTVSISGSNFLPSTPLTVKLGTTTTVITSGTSSDASGNVSATFTVPNLSPGSYPVTVSDGPDTVTSATPFVLSNPYFVVSPSTSTPNAGTAFTVTLTAKDATGNTDTTYTGTHTIAWSGANSSPIGNAPTYPVAAVNFVSGVSTTSLSATMFAAGNNALTATSAGIAGSTTVTVQAGSAAGIALSNITTAPSPALSITGAVGTTLAYSSTGESNNSGNVLTASVAIVDVYGNPVNAASTQTIDLSTAGNGLVVPNGTNALTINGGSSTSTATFTLTRTTGNNKTVTLTAILHGSTQQFTVTLKS